LGKISLIGRTAKTIKLEPLLQRAPFRSLLSNWYVSILSGRRDSKVFTPVRSAGTCAGFMPYGSTAADVVVEVVSTMVVVARDAVVAGASAPLADVPEP